MISKLISTVLGAGYSPLAPGTAGSLVAFIIFWLLPQINIFVWLFAIILLFFVGVCTATATEREQIEKVGNERGHDPSIIVIDEFVGMLIALVAIPHNIYFMIAAFMLFRLFDIVKPFPINISQKLPRGWGVMIDDVIAGIYSNMLIQIFLLINQIF